MSSRAARTFDESLPLWTLAEAAAHLKVSKNTLRNWRRRGDIDVLALPGGGLRIPNSEIERVLSYD